MVGQPLIRLFAGTIDYRDEIHEWLPPGLTLLGGKTKAGKSTLAEQIAEEISREKRVLYLALSIIKEWPRDVLSASPTSTKCISF